jgi:hypothetical protein
MTLIRGLVLAVVALFLISVAGAWYYLFGPNAVPSAKLVPADTIVFANIPNAASIATGYETSQVKKLADAPEMQPLFDEIQKLIGDKNLALLKVLLPDLSGQSFIALTHFDPSKPGETGFVAAMKPKAGTDNFDTFITQVNAAYPDLAKETKTGHDKLLGVDYQWIQGNNEPGRICVAHYQGWIVTAWGEASLQDWLERMQGKSATPSLADNADYQKSLDRVGKDAQAVLYLDYHQLMQLVSAHMDKISPGFSARMQKPLAGIGAAVIGTSFDNGEIVDRFSLLQPKQAQLDRGMTGAPCPFETLKFTGPDTRFYLGTAVNWQQIWKNFQDQLAAQPPALHAIFDRLQSWAQSENIDVQKNIIDALGSEYSLQVEWPADSSYPDVGFFFKVDKPDDFKPAVAALIDTARKEFATSAVITEMNSGGIDFATLKTVRPLPVSPTVTEDGPWFGIFLNAQHAVRAMARDESRGLLHNDDFTREIGDQRSSASEIIYFDSPKFLDQTYRTGMPYLSMAAMFNPTIAGLLKDRHLPPDLTWLAPMGPWAAVIKSDDDGLTGYSRSGVGNQGILLVGGAGGSLAALQMAGILPHPTPHRFTQPVPGNPNAPVPATTVTTPTVPPSPPAPVAPATPPTPSDANSATNSPTPASTH